MKFIQILSFLILAGVITSCTQDELADGIPSAQGKQPLVLTASFPASTRATVNNYWNGGETVYVQVIEDYKGGTPEWPNAEILACTVSPEDNKTIVFPEGKEIYWDYNDEHKLIRAWWRGDNSSSLESDFSVSLNQSSSSGYPASDFVLAQAELTFEEDGNRATLSFYHQMAKVILNVKHDNISASEYINACLFTYAQGRFTPPADVNTEYGNWNTIGRQDDQILMNPRYSTEEYKGSYEEIVFPQTKSKGDDVFSLTKSSYLFGIFVYRAPEAFTWKPGHVYTYTVTVKPPGLEVSVNESIGWNTGTGGTGEVTL